jgi:hypothetical protein
MFIIIVMSFTVKIYYIYIDYYTHRIYFYM